MNKQHIFNYSLKVWLTTSLVAPILITLLRFIRINKLLMSSQSDQYHKFFLRQSGMVIGSLIVLIPLFAVVYYAIIFLSNGTYHSVFINNI
ncbi:hypothetical protein HDF19_06045 [Mucilaginibacter sp. E4BP6]|uniref:hypothetical protein n=1 Tax=Mucilaginibacter sp. E4BP6 TaxID=2723089 RepID=UPI0015CAA963|nr:hypothetical protein [Mucilaginibacter sp. E4BP6]NYE68650.1 hypothetical protein [Mucilaginibacter sp. E4BP6]